VAVPFVLEVHAEGPLSYGREGTPSGTALEGGAGLPGGRQALVFVIRGGAFAAVLETLAVGGSSWTPGRLCMWLRGDLWLNWRGARRVSRRSVATSPAPRPPLAAIDGAGLLWCESPYQSMMAIAIRRTVSVRGGPGGGSPGGCR